jgi:hypothetical protein
MIWNVNNSSRQYAQQAKQQFHRFHRQSATRRQADERLGGSVSPFINPATVRPPETALDSCLRGSERQCDQRSEGRGERP